MNSFTKAFLVVTLLIVAPMKHYAQQPQQTKLTEINIHNVETIEERVFIMHAIQQSQLFSYRLGDQKNMIDIYVSDEYECEDSNANADFDAFMENLEVEWMAHCNLDKNERGRLFVEWRYQLDDPTFLMVNEDFHRQLRDNSTCEGADPFCTDNGLYQFPAGTNAGNLGSSQTVPYYCSSFVRPNGSSSNCLYTTPNPAFYYMQISQPGNLNIYMYSTPSHDIDFDCWGPFTDITTACSQLSCSNMVDCSYSAAATENCYINNAQTGQYYILLITNYSNQSCNISFSNIGTGTTNCDILPPLVSGQGPYCVGETIQLTAQGPAGATYSWTGPGGFSSTQQNPTRPNCTLNMAGEYTCTITVGSQSNSANTHPVVIYPMPSANFTYTSACQGTATQFTSTSTTNPSGQQIQSYQWNFGDGQTGTGQSVSHIYANAGNYQVTLTTSCGNGHCTSSKTYSVPVYAAPTASATAQPSTVIYGGVANLNANAGATGTFNFHWEPENLVVNPNSQTTQTVPLQATTTFTVTITNPQGGCSSTAQVTVSMEGSNLTALASADQSELCQDESTTLHAQPSGGTGNFTYNWTPANTLNDAHSQNPVATPPVGTTTYTCTVGDGITTQNVSVTILVHPNEHVDIYETVCQNEFFNFFGQDLNTPGVYEQTIQSHYGCDSVISLHLSNWDIYETPITRHFCQGESYNFFGEQLNHAGVYYHTLSSVHNCDSVIRLNLVQDPSYEFELFESTCEGGPGYYYNGSYLAPSSAPYPYHFTSALGCDSLVILHVGESEYNSRTYTVSLCAEEYTWPSNGRTYYASGTFYDTLSYPGSCDSTLTLQLTLRPSYHNNMEVTECDSYHWYNPNYNVDMTFTESGTYTHHYVNDLGCDSEAVLYLTINDHDDITAPVVETCDEYYWDPQGHEIIYTDHEYPVYDMSGTYHRTYKNQYNCDSLVTCTMRFEYTPQPTEIYPVDANNTAPHWVVTATEFQVNSYDFNIWEEGHPSICHWDSIVWQFEDPSLNWVLEPDQTTTPPGKKCRVYVLNYVQDTIWLRTTVYNKCAREGVTQRYWFVCSYYDVEEQIENPVDFSVVPNPNNGMMTLMFENLSGKIDVKVYDMTGSLIDNITTYSEGGTETMHYDMHHRSEGIYFIVATGKEGTAAKKVVIKR